MRREQLEEAISALIEAIERNAPEAEFQDLFETHPAVMESLGFVRWIARPVLPLGDQRSYVPDLLAQLPAGLWVVVDLKTPGERILLDRQRRNAFTATMASYISQLHDYREYFDDQTQRRACADSIGVNIHQDPDMLIIAGLSSTVDAVEIHRHLRREHAGLAIVTFDEVLSALQREHARNFGSLEGLLGLNFFLRIRLARDAQPRPAYITEVWDDSETTCAIYLDERNRLVIDMTSSDTEMSASAATQLSTNDFGRWVVLACEFGSGPDGVVLQVRVDDRVVATQLLAGAELNAIQLEHGVLGADRTGSCGAAFDLAEHLAYGRILTFPERRQLSGYLLDRNEEPVSQWIAFNGSQWMEFDAGSGDRNLRQPDPNHRPRLCHADDADEVQAPRREPR